eukprot:GCRY01002366.1.p1 GENE.GCRY01002366.1~~GCRY01002366.1.p1  ORF type:complete len:279 (-),score=32.40 GCRY01002366.1:33-869(-)
MGSIVRGLELVAKLAFGLGAAGYAVQSSLYDVDGGECAVMFNRHTGVDKKVKNEGTHFMVPWLQRPIIYDVRTRPRNFATTTGSKDLQTVNLTLRLLYKPEVHSLPELYTVYGEDYEERVLPSVCNEVLKQVVADFEAAELINKREVVSRKINDMLIKRLKEFHVIVDDVAITHLNFGPEFTRAIERKQVAHQEAERARYVVEKDKLETKARIIQAEGESMAAKVISDSLKAGPYLVELRRIEAAKNITSILANSRNITFLPAAGKDGGSNLLLNIQQ